ncbi:MAG TPA: anthranilate phosphoribosyltransferase [Bryobacteraceae bacterium]|nr:anthranilate phosphoribosyltransferase [Bryobacteraceae bacterium]
MLLPYLHRVAARENLSAEEARQAMLAVLSGQSSTPQIAAFLVALRMKGETPDELLGFARAMRERAARVEACVDSQPLLDTCGTGGDGGSTFNISTIAAFVVAGAGVRVAKHGNRSLASVCGSADLLEELGVRLETEPEGVARAIREVGIGFMFAPAFHPAMKHAQPARAELKMRTVFNLLGPLANPAGATRQLIGAPSAEAAELMANALAQLGSERSYVVHGSDGMDEVTTTGLTMVFEVTQGQVQKLSWSPADFGVALAVAADLTGGDRARNRHIAMSVLQGECGARRDIVLVNAAAALVVAGMAADLRDAMRLAAESIDSGAALKKVRKLAEFSGR